MIHRKYEEKVSQGRGQSVDVARWGVSESAVRGKSDVASMLEGDSAWALAAVQWLLPAL